MNKKDLIDCVSAATDLPKSQAQEAVTATLNAIATGLDQDGTVALAGFGSFKVQEYAARKGRNPQSGEEIEIPARKTVKFKPGKGLKEEVA